MFNKMKSVLIPLILFLVINLTFPALSFAQTPTPTDQFGPNFNGVINRGDHNLELPKTGLDPIYWVLLGLIPLGLKLINFDKSKEKLTPNQVWQKKQL